MLKLIAFALLVISSLGNPNPKIWRTSKINRSGRESRIVGGTDAKPGELPFVVSVNFIGDGHACGASILTNNWLLTSAQCCAIGNLYIYAGSISLSRGGVNYDIVETIMHEKFDSTEFRSRNDICLVRIDGTIEFNNDVQPIALAPEYFIPPEGTPMLTTGWGYTVEEGHQDIPDTLQVLQQTAVPIATCAEITFGDPFPGQMCAIGAGDQGMCNGDAGGPLIFNGTQVGIASYVFHPCDGYWPDYYTRVTDYISWMKNKMGSDANQLKISTF